MSIILFVVNVDCLCSKMLCDYGCDVLILIKGLSVENMVNKFLGNLIKLFVGLIFGIVVLLLIYLM